MKADVAGPRCAISSSLIVATRDRAALLADCLDAVAALAHQPDEVIVVDNTSGDPQVEALAGKHHARYLVEPTVGVSAARNTGARHAASEVVVFLDDDAAPLDGWLPALLEAFRAPDVAAVTGRSVPMDDDGGEAAAIARRWMDFGPERRTVDMSTDHWFEMATFGGLGNGNNTAFRRGPFIDIGGFRVDLGLGTDINGGEEHHAFFDLIRRGYQVVHQPEATVRHCHPQTLAEWHEYRRQSLAEAAARATMLLVEEPSVRGRVLKYLWNSALGRSRQWEPRRGRVGEPHLSAVEITSALVAGTRAYVRTRRQTPRRPPSPS